MEIGEIISEALGALGVEAATPLRQGGQKIVLRGELSHKPVVVKVVPIPKGPHAYVAVQRAQREVELLTSIESDYVVRVMSEAIAIGDELEAICWAEELLDGADIGDLLSDKWSDSETLRLIHHVGMGLDACHQLDVVHRDLSPGNVRRLSTGRFVLMDPGLARYLERTALTGEFQPGTSGFRSPEHVPGGEPTPASDVFSLGILAFLVRTLNFPVDPSGQDEEYYRRLLETQAPLLQSVEKGVSDELASIVDRCLQRQPARRFLDGSELIAEFASDPLDES